MFVKENPGKVDGLFWTMKENVLEFTAIFEYNPITSNTAQKMKFSIKDFFGKCDEIRKNLNGKLRF